LQPLFVLYSDIRLWYIVILVLQCVSQVKSAAQCPLGDVRPASKRISAMSSHCARSIAYQVTPLPAKISLFLFVYCWSLQACLPTSARLIFIYPTVVYRSSRHSVCVRAQVCSTMPAGRRQTAIRAYQRDVRPMCQKYSVLPLPENPSMQDISQCHRNLLKKMTEDICHGHSAHWAIVHATDMYIDMSPPTPP
jgi:hypothetical protein